MHDGGRRTCLEASSQNPFCMSTTISAVFAERILILRGSWSLPESTPADHELTLFAQEAYPRSRHILGR